MGRPHAYVITMSQSWHGRTEEYSNIFHYKSSTAVDTEQGFRDAALQIVAKMKEFHGNGVNFVRYSVWGPTDEVNENLRLVVVDGTLTGTGVISSGQIIAPDASVVFSYYVGRNQLGQRNRFLRNQFRIGMLQGANQLNAAFGTAKILPADLTFYKGKANDLKTLAVGTGNINRCTPGGDGLPIATDAKVLEYLSRRQFRRG